MFAQTKSRKTNASQSRLSGPVSLFSGGIAAGTLIETDRGWRSVDELCPGDRIMTFDGGLRELRAVSTRRLDSPMGQVAHMMEVPGGVLDTCSDLSLPADQYVLLDLAAVEASHDSPLALVPAAALEDWNGIRRKPAGDRSLSYTLCFDDEEIVFANTGAMLHCAAPEGTTLGSSFFNTLSFDETRSLLGLPQLRADAPHLRLIHAA